MMHFATTLSVAIQETLWLPDFWISEHPRSWLPINCLTKLLEQHPELNNQSAHYRLMKDAAVIKDHVIPGTIAETAIDSFLKQLKAANTDPALKEFWQNHATSIAKTTLSYHTTKLQFRSALAVDVTDDLEDANRKKRKTPDNGTGAQVGAEEAEERPAREEQESSIWDEWRRLLKDPHIALSWHALSPERHGIIWCGKQVRRRFFIPEHLYARTLEEIPPLPRKAIGQPCQNQYATALKAENIQSMKKTVKLLQNLEEHDQDSLAEVEYLVDMLNIFVKTVFPLGGSTLKHSENCLKSDALWPALQVVASYMRSKNHEAIFYTGEEELVSMTEELKKEGQTDGRLKYLADGILRLNNYEALIFEASSAYEKTTSTKAAFDHFKGMFGTLAILKHIASKYRYATFATFKKLRIQIIHAHGSAIRHWTMSVPDEGIYLMTKVDKSEVPLSLANKEEKETNPLQHFVQFHLNLLGALEETAKVVKILKTEHQEYAETYRFEEASAPQRTLEDLVQPILVRLSEKRHAKYLEQDGPHTP